jgi:roadblock/LC7 domain-containing protein
MNHIDKQIADISRRIAAVERRGKVVYTQEIAGYTIQLRKRSANSFTVVYGKQVKPLLSYADAAKELGQCIMHALACEGRLD